MKVVVAGGSGALGRRLCSDLAGRGHEVGVLTRSPGRSPHRQVQWDGLTVGSWARELPGSAVVNLAGELVDRRPTRAGVDLLTRSRVQPTRALAEAAAALDAPVLVAGQHAGDPRRRGRDAHHRGLAGRRWSSSDGRCRPGLGGGRA